MACGPGHGSKRPAWSDAQEELSAHRLAVLPRSDVGSKILKSLIVGFLVQRGPLNAKP